MDICLFFLKRFSPALWHTYITLPYYFDVVPAGHSTTKQKYINARWATDDLKETSGYINYVTLGMDNTS